MVDKLCNHPTISVHACVKFHERNEIYHATGLKWCSDWMRFRHTERPRLERGGGFGCTVERYSEREGDEGRERDGRAYRERESKRKRECGREPGRAERLIRWHTLQPRKHRTIAPSQSAGAVNFIAFTKFRAQVDWNGRMIRRSSRSESCQLLRDLLLVEGLA